MRLIFSQPIALLAISLALTGCGGSDQGVKVKVVIEKPLQPDIRATAKKSQKPGVVNPIEVSVTLENTGANDHQILLEGKWQDNGGRGYGGASDSRKIPAGSSIVFEAGTRTQSVTKMVLKVSSTALDADQFAASAMSQINPAVAGNGISYTATPSLDQIPNWVPKGVANGAPFVAGTILFAPINGVWELQIIDREIDPLKGIALARSMDGNAGLQTIHLRLPDEPETGTILDRKMSYGDGYFQIQDSPGSSVTTSWNSEIAWVLEIEEWNRQPYDEAGGNFQQGGTVSGRLYVCFKGSSDKIQSSFVAGVFEKAPIVYYGNPDR